MNPLEFVIAIVFMVLAYRVVSRVLQNRASRPTDTPEVNADLVRQIAELEERVRVLERIVTDDRSDLRRQFKELGG
jgi:hypothetical protein